MRLVDICEFFSEFGGGVKTYAHEKLAASAACGVATTIIAPGPADRRERRLGGEIIFVRSPILPFDHRYHMFSDLRPLHALLQELAPDVVEGSSPWRGGWAAATWRGPAARALFLHQDPIAVYPQSLLSPLISADRVDALCGWFWAYLRRLSAKFDAVIAPSDFFARRLRKFRLADPCVCPPGVDTSTFSHRLRDEDLRRDMLRRCGAAPRDALLFVAVGRHHPEKRLTMLIKGFRLFAARRPAALFVIGDGPSWRAVERAAQRAPGVFVAGAETDRRMLARRLASADYLLHGSSAETFGFAVAEAIASGLPIVAPDAGAAADLVHLAYSETYAFGRAAALAEAIARITQRDRAALALAARAAARRLSAPDQHFAQLFDFYRTLAARRSARAA
jgi:alpha-1,6-mannosyltransferase